LAKGRRVNIAETPWSIYLVGDPLEQRLTGAETYLRRNSVEKRLVGPKDKRKDLLKQGTYLLQQRLTRARLIGSEKKLERRLTRARAH
jgi:hypothetical protein